MKFSVIISYYKNLPFLDLVLQGLQKQSYTNFEVIIAEDTNELQTIEFIRAHKFNFVLKHVSQNDDGFRKCKILNKALLVSEGQHIIFLDGDCIPHPKLVETYFKYHHLGVCYGRRVLLSEKFTNKTIQDNIFRNSVIKLLFSKTKHIRHSLFLPFRKPSIEENKGIWGCNWGAPKTVLLSINGFDEDYVQAGIGEDVDIEWRLRNEGHPLYYLKHLAIVYHLHHKVHYNDTIVKIGLEQLAIKKEIGIPFCANGIEKQ